MKGLQNQKTLENIELLSEVLCSDRLQECEGLSFNDNDEMSNKRFFNIVNLESSFKIVSKGYSRILAFLIAAKTIGI